MIDRLQMVLAYAVLLASFLGLLLAGENPRWEPLLRILGWGCLGGVLTLFLLEGWVRWKDRRT